MAKCNTICTPQERTKREKLVTAKIKTQYGMTRTIKMKDSIRQGGVLSVIEYANLIDEIAKQLQTEKIGEGKIWTTWP